MAVVSDTGYDDLLRQVLGPLIIRMAELCEIIGPSGLPQSAPSGVDNLQEIVGHAALAAFSTL